MGRDRFRRLAADFFVAPQLEASDFAAAAATGIRTVINNRPDGEAMDQLADAEARDLAAAAGLAYAYVPVVTGGIGPQAMAAFSDALAAHPGPYLAYCRSGTRSCFMWGLHAARRQAPQEILKAAAAVGYDLTPAAAALRQIHEAG
jgi:uncharacterized protein (TIGR01244 family)